MSHVLDAKMPIAMLQFDSRWRNGWRNFSTMQVFSTASNIKVLPLRCMDANGPPSIWAAAATTIDHMLTMCRVLKMLPVVLVFDT
jgi:hypothetical protein